MTLQTQISVLTERLNQLKEDVINFCREAKEDFVTCKEFLPVKSLVYGFTSIILVTVITAIIALVVTRK